MRTVDWNEVAKIIEKCVEGSGHVLSKKEDMLLRKAVRSDPDRYRKLHKEIK